jgi:hypothetical protein
MLNQMSLEEGKIQSKQVSKIHLIKSECSQIDAIN